MTEMIVVNHAVFKADEMNGATFPPSWRKATRNMVMASAALKKAWQDLPEKLRAEKVFALVVQTSSGELETSAEFLINWSKSRLARPVLFQNSLHSATAGFASIEFNFQGPALTVSGHGDEAFLTAGTLLQAGLCDFAFVVKVEAHKKMVELMAEPSLSEGAEVWIVSHEKIALDCGLPVMRKLPAGRFKMSADISLPRPPFVAFAEKEF